MTVGVPFRVRQCPQVESFNVEPGRDRKRCVQRGGQGRLWKERSSISCLRVNAKRVSASRRQYVTQSPSRARQEIDSPNNGNVGRRSFLKGLGMAGASLAPVTALLMNEGNARAQEFRRRFRSGLTKVMSIYSGSWRPPRSCSLRCSTFGGFWRSASEAI